MVPAPCSTELSNICIFPLFCSKTVTILLPRPRLGDVRRILSGRYHRRRTMFCHRTQWDKTLAASENDRTRRARRSKRFGGNSSVSFSQVRARPDIGAMPWYGGKLPSATRWFPCLYSALCAHPKNAPLVVFVHVFQSLFDVTVWTPKDAAPAPPSRVLAGRRTKSFAANRFHHISDF